MPLMQEAYAKCGEVFTVPVGPKRVTFLIGPNVSPHFFKAGDADMSQSEVRCRWPGQLPHGYLLTQLRSRLIVMPCFAAQRAPARARQPARVSAATAAADGGCTGSQPAAHFPSRLPCLTPPETRRRLPDGRTGMCRCTTTVSPPSARASSSMST